MSLRLLSLFAFKETLRLNLYDAVLSGSPFEGMVVTRAVLVMNFRVIEQRCWRISTRSQVAEDVIIIPQQGIDQGNEAARNMTNRASSPFVRLRLFVVGTEARN